VDPEKEAALNQARSDDTALEVGPSEIRYWLDFENPTLTQSPGEE
jgi:hypothetical protein